MFFPESIVFSTPVPELFASSADAGGALEAISKLRLPSTGASRLRRASISANRSDKNRASIASAVPDVQRVLVVAYSLTIRVRTAGRFDLF